MSRRQQRSHIALMLRHAGERMRWAVLSAWRRQAHDCRVLEPADSDFGAAASKLADRVLMRTSLRLWRHWLRSRARPANARLQRAKELRHRRAKAVVWDGWLAAVARRRQKCAALTEACGRANGSLLRRHWSAWRNLQRLWGKVREMQECHSP